jgi:hypothetical protein
MAVLAVVIAGGVFAQNSWYNSYAPGIDGSKIFVNAGIGVGILPYKMSIPPISASVEYALPNIPLSLGGYFGITGYNEEENIGSASYTYKGTLVGFGAKASYHFNFIKNLDPYVSLLLGWLVWNEEVTATVHPQSYGAGPYSVSTPGSTATAEEDMSTFLYGFNIGARYFFTPLIGAYAELGYSAVSVLSVGVTLKF